MAAEAVGTGVNPQRNAITLGYGDTRQASQRDRFIAQ
jgi:hypothetical protein